MNVCESIIVSSGLFADREAIVFEGQGFSYRQIELRSRKAAALLQEGEIQRGDRVALVIPNVPAFVVWYFACLRLGAIAVSVSTRLKGDEVAFIVNDCGARILISTAECLEPIEAALPAGVEHVWRVSDDGSSCESQPLDSGEAPASGFVKMEPGDPATILYTSGTTGFPKGATLSHRNVRATVHAFNHLCQMRTEDRLLLSVPLFHCYGQNALLNAGFNVGATILLERRFDLHESRRLIAEYQVTKLFGVPTTFQLLLDACSPEDLASVEYCFSAAATLPIQVSRRWNEKFNMPIHEGYGLTETAPFASYNHRLAYREGSLGTPVDLVEMKIVDTDTGQECPPRSPGEIAIRGPNVMLGYWNRPQETADAVRDGWFFSGDIGETDEQGYFYILDRLKDMISVGGMKVFPAEVERVLLDHPGVAEAAVVGFPDQVMGERVAAFLVGQTPHMDADAVREYCRRKLASFKVPTSIAMVESLPRNPAGKVLKTELRSWPLPAEPPASPTQAADVADSGQAIQAAPQGELLVRLSKTHPARRARVLADHLQDEVQHLVGLQATPDQQATFLDIGMDSTMLVEFQGRLQWQLGPQIELPSTSGFEYPTITALTQYLMKAIPDPSSSPASAVMTPDGGTSRSADLTKTIQEMSEESALKELLRELDE